MVTKHQKKQSINRVQIDDIPRLEWGRNTENSFIRSAQLTLNALGENFSYPYLMSISGAAFKFQFHPDWCPSAADATTGFDVSGELFKGAGYEFELIKIDDSKFSEIQELYRKIREQIDHGIPIVAINLKTCPEWGIITGYLLKRPGIICRTYFDEGEDYSMAEHAPWMSFFIRKKIEAPARKSIFLHAIKTAIKLAKTDSFENYKSGLAAFESWIDQLKTYTHSGISFKHHEVNLTLLHALIDARHAAFSFLMDIKKDFDLKSIDAIIENYKREYMLLKDILRKLPRFEDPESAWIKTLLSEQIRVIKELIQIEKETIALLEESLSQPINDSL